MSQYIKSDIYEELDSKMMQEKQHTYHYVSPSSTISKVRQSRKISRKRPRTLIDQLEDLCLRNSRLKKANTRKTQEPCLRRVNMIHNQDADMEFEEWNNEEEQNEDEIVEISTSDMIPYSYAQYEEVTNRKTLWQKQNASHRKAKSIYSFLQDASLRHQYTKIQETKGKELIIYRTPQLPIDLSVIQHLSDEELMEFKQLLGKDVCQVLEKQISHGDAWEKKKQKEIWNTEKDGEKDVSGFNDMMEDGNGYDSFSYINDEDDDVNMDLDPEEPIVPHCAGIISHSEWFRQSDH